MSVLRSVYIGLWMAVLPWPVVALAGPGNFDTTFGGGDGWVSLGSRLYQASDTARAVIQQADGKLVAAGYSFDGLNDNFSLVRYNMDGALDNSFGNGGRVITPVGLAMDQAYSLTQQLDGKLVVAGYSDTGSSEDMAVLRYDENGALDVTFDGDGIVTTDFGSNKSERAYSVVQQSDGKLVVAGYGRNSLVTADEFMLVRYNSDGSLDTTFNANGKLLIAIGSSTDQAYSIIQQSDGKLVAAGYSRIGSTDDFSLVRVNANGSLDTGFSDDGKLTVTFGTGQEQGYSVIQQADGKLVVAGYSRIGSTDDFALARINADGTLDGSFDGDGRVTAAVGSAVDRAYAVVQQADGKLVMAGQSENGINEIFALVRCNADGSLDATFDGDGRLSIPSSAARAHALSLLADDKLLVAGLHAISAGVYDFSLAKINIDGTLDPTFGNGGRVLTNVSFTSNDTGSALVYQSDGHLTVVGASHNGLNSDVGLVRVDHDGVPDIGFGDTGIVTTVLGGGTDIAYAALQQSDGKLVTSGFSTNGSTNDFALVRYNLDGSLDTSFGSDGKALTAFGSGNNRSYAVVQQFDGKLVVAGFSSNGNNDDFALVRYNPDGSLDTSFDGDGKLRTDIAAGNDYARSILQQENGKLLVAGYGNVGGINNFVLVRYNLDGSLDENFDGDGKVTTAFAGSASAYSVVQQPDGKLVVAGSSFYLARYNQDGSLDTTFDNDGKVTASIGVSATAYSLLRQSDGKLVAAGINYNGSYMTVVVARYTHVGALDTTFGTSGKAVLNVSGGDNYATSIAQQIDGKLVIGGNVANVSSGQEFFVARLESGQPDTDSDGLVDWLDTDNDGDGMLNASDAFPLDPGEWLDTDSDTLGNNTDWDDDGDGVPDTVDGAPLDAGNAAELSLPLEGVYKGGRLGNGALVQ